MLIEVCRLVCLTTWSILFPLFALLPSLLHSGADVCTSATSPSSPQPVLKASKKHIPLWVAGQTLRWLRVTGFTYRFGTLLFFFFTLVRPHSFSCIWICLPLSFSFPLLYNALPCHRIFYFTLSDLPSPPAFSSPYPLKEFFLATLVWWRRWRGEGLPQLHSCHPSHQSFNTTEWGAQPITLIPHFCLPLNCLVAGWLWELSQNGWLWEWFTCYSPVPDSNHQITLPCPWLKVTKSPYLALV